MKIPPPREWLALYGELPDKKRQAVWLAACALTFLAYVGLLGMGQHDTLNAYIEQGDQAEVARQEKERFSRDLPRYESQLTTMSNKLTAAHQVLPDNPDMPQFLAKLGAMARDLSVTIDRFEPQAETNHDFYAELGLHVKVRGTYHELATFLDQVSNLERIVTIANVVLSEPKAQENRILLDGEFDLKTYRFLTDKQVADLAAAGTKKP